MKFFLGSLIDHMYTITSPRKIWLAVRRNKHSRHRRDALIQLLDSIHTHRVTTARFVTC